ncbi:c-type cytochrome [bacterium]|nr:c-type cytochrome [bacterium]
MPAFRASLLALFLLAISTSPLFAELKVGAAVVDVTPETFPVLINGGFLPRKGEPKDIHARAIVLDDGNTRIALVVTDSCMMPKDLLDSAKQLAAQRSQIPADHMLISATHTHTAPSSMGALGTDADPTYVPYLRIKLAEAILQAEKNLAPAQVGWGTIDANQFTASRRWILRRGQEREDPFGVMSVRASMHTAKNNMANVIGPSGPEDPDLSVISFQTPEGKPIALLANFSMHYYSGGGAADYFGAYCRKLEEDLGSDADKDHPFVAIMSHGCSGDIWRYDYSDGTTQTFDGFVDGMVAKTKQAIDSIEYQRDAPLAMAEKRMTLNYRVPSEERLAWAKKVMEEMGDRPLKTASEVYAREQIILHERQSTEIVVQAIKVGSIAIASTPNETYALSGLKIKRRSPFEHTMVIELANGGDGYIPPPEQHLLGGYNTWAARSAGLEVQAEPKIVEADIQLLEKVSGQPRRKSLPPSSKMAETIGKLKPIRYYPLDDMEGPQAEDFSPANKPATYEDGVVFYLPGADGPALSTADNLNRAAQFVDGRVVAQIDELHERATFSLWISNGLDLDAQPIAGWFLSAGFNVGVAGKGEHAGQLIVQTQKDGPLQYGKTKLDRWSWAPVTVVRSGTDLRVYVNNKLDIEAKVAADLAMNEVFIGGSSSNQDNWQGRIDEVAIFDRVLTPPQIATLQDDGHADQADNSAKLSAEDRTKGGRHWVDDPTPAPRSPEEELASFQIEPGYHVELVAAEPLVMDPVAIAFDIQGRMFVAEYSDYPIGPSDPNADPLSRIVMLEDTNGDGQMDKRTVFADKLTFCHSLIPYMGGVLACAQSELILLQDTNGDGVADDREVLFQGFQPAHAQMQIGCPRWGLDNRIYLNYGIGKITSVGQTKPTSIPRTEFWFDPVTWKFGSASGTGQYGNTITRWGDRLFSTNRNPIMTVTMSAEDAARNRFAPITNVKYDVAPSGGDSKVFPLIAMKSNWLSHAGTHTSACGTTAYVGDQLGPKMIDSVFACEPIGHLVTRSIVKRDGTRLISTRAREDADFLAATDSWFRPASLANGPDGNLYLADMYRLWVEHPKFLPPEIAAKLDWRAGDDRGRIWRIVPDDKSKSPAYTPPKDIAETVAMLNSTNGWQRRTAQQFLVETQQKEAAPALTTLATGADLPLTRLHAFWTLEGLGKLQAATIEHALNDKHPEVRASAVRLAARHWDQSPELLPLAMKHVDDESTWVRFQLALALGNTNAPTKVVTLAKLVQSDGQDEAFADAIITASETCAVGILQDSQAVLAERTAIARRLAKVVGARGEASDSKAVLQLALQQKPIAAELAILRGLAEGCGSSKKFNTLIEQVDGAESSIAKGLTRTAENESQPPHIRSSAVWLLRFANLAGDELFVSLCNPRQPLVVQQEAIAALVAPLTKPRETQLSELWPDLEPAARDAAISLLLKRSDGADFILSGIEQGRIPRSSLSLDQQAKLRAIASPELRKQVEQILGKPANTDRMAVIDKYAEVSHTIGSAPMGRGIFLKNCAKCHTPAEPGKESIGPDLADSQNRAREALLFDILNPSGKVEPKYLASQVLTTSGQAYSGIIVHESPQSILLQMADGKTQEIVRADIDTMQTSDRSLMPDGMEKEISHEQMANLIEFLKSPLPKTSTP